MPNKDNDSRKYVVQDTLRIGHYKFSPRPDPVKKSIVRYIYVDESYISSQSDDDFLDDLFMALGFSFNKRDENGNNIKDSIYYQPNLILSTESFENFDKWNLRLPISKLKNLAGKYDREVDERTISSNTIGSTPAVNPNLEVAKIAALTKYRKTIESGCRKALKVIANVADVVSILLRIHTWLIYSLCSLLYVVERGIRVRAYL